MKPSWTELDNSDYDIGGNINSLVKVDFENDTNCYTFYGYFQNKLKLKSGGRLILPATTLTDNCYQFMFNGCTSLTQAPALPATTLVEGCYIEMFSGCTSLTQAPELPVTTLVEACYCGMFQGCTSLTQAPALPATTLAVECYFDMFYGCTSLTSAPALSATTLADGCYYEMFSGCTNLNYIKCLATDISAEDCLTSWTDGVAATGTFVKDPSMESWATGADGIPEGWTVQDAQE